MPQQNFHHRRISLVAGMIVLVAALVVGLTVFIIMQRYAEEILSRGLQLSLENRVQLLQGEIGRGFDRMGIVATRPLLVDQIEEANAGLDENEVRLKLEQVAQNFLATGLTAIAFLDANGRELAHAGTFTRKSALTVPLHSAEPMQLMWDGKLLLHATVDLKKAGHVVGKLIAETALPVATAEFRDARRLGKTGDLALCAPYGRRMQCFPTTLYPVVMTLLLRSADGHLLPMAHALAGETGFISNHDYRHQQVVAAYAPVGDLGLGMVLKMDSAELFSPLWNQLRYLIPVLLGVFLSSLLLLRWLLTPLVARLVRSEEEARGISADLRNSEHRLQTLLDNAGEGIVSMSDTGSIELFNPGAERIFGYQPGEVIGKNLSALMAESHRTEHGIDLSQYAGREREVLGRRSDGELFPMELRVSEFYLEGQRKYIGILRDVTERKQTQQTLEAANLELERSNAELERIAHYDVLTSLPNRALLADRMQQAMAQSKRHNKSVAIVYLDLDGFKAVNDRHGHLVGDELLLVVAQRLKEALRDGDSLARIGGDEFVVVLVDLEEPQHCEPILARLLRAAADPVTVGNVVLQVSASIGVTFYPQDEAEAEQLMRHADQAMYAAKQSGKNRYHLFDVAQDTAAQAQREMLGRIGVALAQSEFALHYQPKVNMKTGEVLGAEALLRWQHPERGLLRPADFLPIIDDHPLSVVLGDWIIGAVLSQMSAWKIAGLDIPVSINVAGRQLQQDNFVSRLVDLLAAHPDVKPGRLVLEILETSALEDIAQVSEIMHACQAIGVRFALDDFGTGYSSLTYLKRLPAEILKIDQSFVHDMLDDRDDLAIVKGIIGLAKAFRRQVIAEGVETVAHEELLLRLGCELMQGYGIARPMAAPELPGWVATWRQNASRLEGQ